MSNASKAKPAQELSIKTVSVADLPARGQPLAGGVFITRYWLNNQEHALVILSDELAGPWGEYGQDVIGAKSYSDGEANTQAMAEAGSEIAKQALAIDAFIPSCLQGQLMMTAKADGVITLSEDRWHWLSTQYSANRAYLMDFVDGWLSTGGKFGERVVRPVRSLVIIQ
ncbi:hypothetical protein [Pseudomonas capsici]|uniref:hypothetical protein n=1 Tax=Pseudomonas capsici TaxID=2810614 RepID=UPI0021F12964|nr:hypothetical protein [Pseudomonas capsici]MCV4343265.1 hypothetical protein [Pseudomonas capsici]